jgi:hypothetical protein
MAFITYEMARGLAGQLRERVEADPEFAEDCRSLVESMPYVIEPATVARPIRCEMCGTPVTLVSEAEVAVKPWTYRSAIWEARNGGPWRKHTLRRCNWLRDHAA